MKNAKLILAGILVLLLGSLFISWGVRGEKIKKSEADAARIRNNYFQLLETNKEIKEYFIKEKEVSGRFKTERDSLAKLYAVKPKQIIRYIQIDNYLRDTIRDTVPVYPAGLNTWRIKDEGECFKWYATAKLINDSLGVVRDSLINDNQVKQTFIKNRAHKFLGIPFGKWIYIQKLKPKCGEAKIETINFIK